MPAGRLMLLDDSVHLQLLDIPFVEANSPLNRRPSQWIELQYEETLRTAGIGFLFPDEVLRGLLDRILRRYAADFLGIQETRSILERMENTHGELVKEVLRIVPLQRIAETLRFLIGEGVSIRNQRALLEAMVEWGARETDAARLAEHMRAALARQICHPYADDNRVIGAFVLVPRLEEQLRSTLRNKDLGRETFPEEISRALLAQLRLACEPLSHSSTLVLLVHPELRRSMRRLTVRGEVELSVLSFRELASEYNVQALATIGLTDITNRRAPAGSTVTSLASAS
jgi:type III secretion protein V